MKIKDFAESKGLTKQAIYKAISRAGLSTKQLTDSRGNITRKGSQILNRLFPADPEQERSAPELPDDQDQREQIRDLERQIGDLESRCKEWEKRYFDAVEAHKAETEQLRILISQEQQLRLAAEKKGFLRRLFAGKQKDSDGKGGQVWQE